MSWVIISVTKRGVSRRTRRGRINPLPFLLSFPSPGKGEVDILNYLCPKYGLRTKITIQMHDRNSNLKICKINRHGIWYSLLNCYEVYLLPDGLMEELLVCLAHRMCFFLSYHTNIMKEWDMSVLYHHHHWYYFFGNQESFGILVSNSYLILISFSCI